MSALDKLLARERKLELQLASVRQSILDAQAQATRDLAAQRALEEAQRSAERQRVAAAARDACAAASQYYGTPIRPSAVLLHGGVGKVRFARHAAVLLARARGVGAAVAARELGRSVHWVREAYSRKPSLDTVAIVAIATGTRPEVRS